MPKTFPIRLDVEEIALGPVLRKLSDMPGIAKLHLDLGHGGDGAGRKKLEKHAAAHTNGNGTKEQALISLLIHGPKHVREMVAALGGTKQRLSVMLNTLRRKGITETAGPGLHRLTKKAQAHLGNGAAPIALPAPAKVSHGPSGRASPGSGPLLLRQVLANDTKTASELRAMLERGGMSPKGISGVLDRARKSGIIRKNAAGAYVLTAKGQKIETGATANG